MTYDTWKSTEPDLGLPERCTVCGILLYEPCGPETCPRNQPDEDESMYVIERATVKVGPKSSSPAQE